MSRRATYYTPKDGGFTTGTKSVYALKPGMRQAAIKFILDHEGEDAAEFISMLGLDADVTIEYRVICRESYASSEAGKPFVTYKGISLNVAREDLRTVQWECEQRQKHYDDYTWDAWMEYREVTEWQKTAHGSNESHTQKANDR